MGPHIALYGRSGSGKTTVAEYLVSTHHYSYCSTGAACRQVCRLLFNSESKKVLNQVTDAMRAIDENVWLRTALASAPSDSPIVFDSMRFDTDYRYLRERDFEVWQVDAPLEVRAGRLRERGQEFDPARDDLHPAEVELHGREFDYRIWNCGIGFETLFALVESGLRRGG